MGIKERERKEMYRYLVISLLILLVNTSCAIAPFEEGRKAYEKGDYVTAARLMKPLAEQGDASSQYYLGIMYDEGKGVRQNYVEAMKWYRMAAQQGDARAQFNLGLLYYKGHGVPKNYSEAAKWYMKAAKGNIAQAQVSLGMMHYRGEGVPKDNVLAYMWFDLAASGSHESEDNIKELAVRGRNLLVPLMTPEQIAEARRLATEWKPTKEGVQSIGN